MHQDRNSLKRLLDDLNEVGWPYEVTRNGHYKVRVPDGRTLTFTSSTSDSRAYRRRASDFRRAGLPEALATVRQQRERARLHAIALSRKEAVVSDSVLPLVVAEAPPQPQPDANGALPVIDSPDELPAPTPLDELPAETTAAPQLSPSRVPRQNTLTSPALALQALGLFDEPRARNLARYCGVSESSISVWNRKETRLTDYRTRLGWGRLLALLQLGPDTASIAVRGMSVKQLFEETVTEAVAEIVSARIGAEGDVRAELERTRQELAAVTAERDDLRRRAEQVARLFPSISTPQE